MLTVDRRLFLGRRLDTLADISVKLRVCETKVVLVGLTAKSVDRGLIDKLDRKSEIASDLLQLGDGKAGDGREIARAVAVAR